MKPLVIGYFTEKTPYEHEAETLKLSLGTHDYHHHIVAVPNLGTWQKNTQYKAKVIKRALEEFPGQALLYLDVDCIMVKPPVILDDIDCDIAACHYGKSTELLSGTVYFSGSAMCKRVVDRWIELNIQYPKRLPNKLPAWDQRTLEMAIKDLTECRFTELPQSYTWIVELTEKVAPGLDPVLMHTRGAKRFKNSINGEAGYAT